MYKEHLGKTGTDMEIGLRLRLRAKGGMVKAEEMEKHLENDIDSESNRNL